MGMDQTRLHSITSPNNGAVAMLFIVVCTAIGVWVAGGVTHDPGTVEAWFWIGIGLAVVYLLTVIADTLTRLGSSH